MAQPNVELGFTFPKASPEITRTPETPIPPITFLFNGQGKYAADLLGRLIADGHEPVGIVTPKPKIENGTLVIDPLRQHVLDLNETRRQEGKDEIPIINLGTVNNADVQEQMRKMQPDLGISMFLQKRLEPETFKIPKYGTLNIHYSLLPDERGRNAMERNILNGYEVLGITTFLTARGMDVGPIAGYFAYENNGESQGSQYHRHSEDAIELVRQSVSNLAIAIHERKNNSKQKLPLLAQNPSEATSNPPLTAEELEVDFSTMTAEEISRKMNAGGPGATTLIEGKKYKIGKPTRLEGPPIQPGRIVEMTDKEVLIEAYQGLIKIGRLQEI